MNSLLDKLFCIFRGLYQHNCIARYKSDDTTAAIKEHLLSMSLSSHQYNFTYASAADMLNAALLGMTARAWRDKYPNLAGNIRDHATIYQFIVLTNLESMNAELIKQGLAQKDRLAYLNKMAIEQMRSLISSAAAQRLNEGIDASNNPALSDG